MTFHNILYILSMCLPVFIVLPYIINGFTTSPIQCFVVHLPSNRTCRLICWPTPAQSFYRVIEVPLSAKATMSLINVCRHDQIDILSFLRMWRSRSYLARNWCFTSYLQEDVLIVFFGKIDAQSYFNRCLVDCLVLMRFFKIGRPPCFSNRHLQNLRVLHVRFVSSISMIAFV